MSKVAGKELRIHGIGNHGPLDALGSPVLGDGTFLSPQSNDPAVVQPVLPAHDVWFVAWTRSSRALNSFAWYLGLPFTLCNTAGHMRSPGWLGPVTAAYAAVVGCLLLTLGAFLWSVVELENLYYDLWRPENVWVVHDVPGAV